MNANNKLLSQIARATLMASIALTGVSALAAGLDSPLNTAGESDPAIQPAGLTRLEVIADLNLWKRAGLDRFTVQAAYGYNGADYENSVREYERLRNGPAFAAEVARLAAEQGITGTTARR